MKINNITVVIADDDEDDKALLLEALVENGVKKEAVILTADGQELLDTLRQHPGRVCIVFLDLNMPRKDGRAALQEIKGDGALKHIPVIIFSTSSSHSDILSSYMSGCNTYFTKPLYYQELVRQVSVIKTYWLDKATLANGQKGIGH